MSTTKSKIGSFGGNRHTLTFVVCLCVSIFLWALLKLSKDVFREVSVGVRITNVPTDKFVSPLQKNSMKILVEGNGLSLLRLYAENPSLTIDFNDLQPLGDDRYRLSKTSREKLSNSYLSRFRIRNTISDTLLVKLEKKYTRKVPVLVHLNVNFQREFQLTELKVQPDSISVSGIKSAMDTLQKIDVYIKKKREVKSNFTEIYKPKNTDFVSYGANRIRIEGIVDKVSERVIRVPVELHNVPEGCQIKIFPTEVPVLCTGDLNLLKGLRTEDIHVVADFDQWQEKSTLPLSLTTPKKRIKLRFLNEKSVDFLMKRQ